MTNYGIYIAKIEEGFADNDSRLRIRIMPQMEKISVDMLPLWPSFFADEAITGEIGDYVWVVCNHDFTVGYVMGYVAPFTQEGNYIDSSIPQDLKSNVNSLLVNLGLQKIALNNLKVSYWTPFSVHFVSRDEGSHYIAFNNGTIHIVRPGEVACKVGDTMMLINSEKVAITAKEILLSGEVKLGTKPKGKVLITQGASEESSSESSSVWA